MSHETNLVGNSYYDVPQTPMKHKQRDAGRRPFGLAARCSPNFSSSFSSPLPKRVDQASLGTAVSMVSRFSLIEGDDEMFSTPSPMIALQALAPRKINVAQERDKSSSPKRPFSDLLEECGGIETVEAPRLKREIGQFQNAYRMASQGKCMYEGIEFHVNPKAQGKGSFCQVHTLSEENLRELQFISGKSANINELLVKVFHGTTRTNPREQMTYALANYRMSLEANLPVATIYNADTALEDGFYIVENVPYPVDPKEWQGYTSIDAMPEKQKNILHQIKKIFDSVARKCLETDYGFAADIKPDNLRIRENGQVVIIDFLEEDPADSSEWGKEDTFRTTINQAIHLLAGSGECSPVRDFLLSDVVRCALDLQ